MYQLVRKIIQGLNHPFLFLKIKVWQASENAWCRDFLYPLVFYSRLDQEFMSVYHVKSPYAIAKDYLIRQKAKDIYCYGETPLKLFYTLFQRWGPRGAEVFIDLGAGAGRALFMGSIFFEGYYVGIERIPTFNHVATRLKQKYLLRNLLFIQGDFRSIDLSRGDIFYYYSLLDEEDEIKKMCNKFVKECKKSSLWITVCFPLADYDPRFEIQDKMEGLFVWGHTGLYLNRLKKE